MARTKYERGYFGADLGLLLSGAISMEDLITPTKEELEIKEMLHLLQQEIINQVRVPSSAFTEPIGSSRVVATTIDIAARVPKSRRIGAGEGEVDEA